MTHRREPDLVADEWIDDHLTINPRFGKNGRPLKSGTIEGFHGEVLTEIEHRRRDGQHLITIDDEVYQQHFSCHKFLIGFSRIDPYR